MPSDPALTPVDRRRGRALVAIVFVAVWGLITHGVYAGSGDEPHYFVIAHSIAFDGDLDVANNYGDAALPGADAIEPGLHARWRDGRLRPVHDVGMPLLFAPFVRVAHPLAAWLGRTLPQWVLDAGRLHASLILRHLFSLAMAFLTGLLARELFFTILELTGRRAFGWALLFALAPPVLSHAFLFFTEIPSALATLWVFRRLSVAGLRSAGVAALAGGLTGLLMLVHVRNVGIVLGLSIVAALAARRDAWPRARVVAFIAGLALLLAVRTAINYQLWGSLVTSPHAAPGEVGSLVALAGEVSRRATGLLFDREYGLLTYAPIYLLAAPGVILLARARQCAGRDALIVMACCLAPILLPITNVHGWTGGWAPAARFLVPIAALLWLGVHALASRAAGIPRRLVLTLVTLQVVISAFAWQWPKTLWNDGDGISAAPWGWLLPSWVDPAAAPVFALAAVVLAVFGYGAGRPAVSIASRSS